MENLLESMFHFGRLMTARRVVVAPNLDDFELMPFVKASQEMKEGFLVILNMILLEPSEVQVEVVEGKILEVRAKHHRRNNTDDFWMEREIVYTYEIPEESQTTTLIAEWSKDCYLVIRENPVQNMTRKVAMDRVRLTPQRKEYSIRPVAEVGLVHNMIEDIQHMAQSALNYIQYYAKAEDEANKIEQSGITDSPQKPLLQELSISDDSVSGAEPIVERGSPTQCRSP